MTRPGLHLHIERLVLHDLPLTAAEAAALQTSLEKELARLYREPSAGQPASTSIDRLPATEILLPAGAGPGGLGAPLARAVHASLAPLLRTTPEPGGAPSHGTVPSTPGGLP